MKMEKGNGNNLYGLIFLILAVFLAAPSYAALQAVGPVNIANGFPAWYQDTTGVAVEQCFEPDNTLCLADPVIVGNAFSEQIGFGAEAFYWVTEALMDSTIADGTSGNALMVLALENAWFNEVPVPGDQMVFGRLRFFIDVPASGRYTVTHPFGVAVFDVSAERIAATNGIRAINANLLSASGFNAALSTNIPLGDFGCDVGPCDFSLALGSGVGPFLRWDTGFPVIGADGKSYLGNPLIEHTITGSPFGTNIFRIEGPSGVDLDPNAAGIQNVIETNLFSVSGRIAVIDTIAPLIGATTPAVVAAGAPDFVASVNVTDDLFIGMVTIDLTSVGNSLTATLNSAQEVPATSSSATGTGTFTIDTAANTLSFSIQFSGLGSAETAAHIHGPAAAGATAVPVFNLSLGSPKTGVWNYPENLEADILAGRMYVNIHSQLFPNGEIRGQILRTSNVKSMTLTAGNRVNGIWSVVIPSINTAGAFSLPIVASDGSNVANGNLALSVVSPLAGVNVTPASASIIVGNTRQLTATPIDLTGVQFVGATVAWSSSNTVVATVDVNGLVTTVAEGTVIITAAATGAGTTVTNTSTITVLPIPVLTSVSVTPASASVAAGGALQLTASPKDQGLRDFVGAAVTWSSSNASVATVSASGLVTTVSSGTAIITASASDPPVTVINAATITVADAASVPVTPATASILVGGTQQMAASVLDSLGNALQGATITWSSNDTAIATVNANGLVTGVALGNAMINATTTIGLQTITSSSLISVVELRSVSVTPATATITVGGTQQLTASPLDQNGAAFAGATIVWNSSAPAIATVDANGLVAAVAAGSATITANATNGTVSVSGSASITVNAPAPAPAPSGGGSGGSGGGSSGGASVSSSSSATATAKSSFMWSEIEVSSKIEVRNDKIGIQEIEIKVKSRASSPSMSVMALESKPAEVPEMAEDKKIFQFLELSHEGLKDSLESAVIKFAVEKSWLSDNNIDKSSVVLERFDGVWKQLPTTLLSEDSVKVFFEAETPGFSVFAITGKEVVAAPAPVEEPQVPEEPIVNGQVDGQLDGTGSAEQQPSEESGVQAAAPVAAPTGLVVSGGMLGIAGLVILVIAALAAVAYRKGMLPGMNPKKGE